MYVQLVQCSRFKAVDLSIVRYLRLTQYMFKYITADLRATV